VAAVVESANKCSKTIKNYTASGRSLAKFLRDHGTLDGIDNVAPEHIRAFLLAERAHVEPSVPEVVKLFSTEAEITALLRTCNGQVFESRRDVALIRILVGSGIRVSRPGRAAVQRGG
jgi:site-specific recombinase XerD